MDNTTPVETTSELDADTIRQRVRTDYAQVARASDAGSCCGEASGCCGVSEDVQINTLISVTVALPAAYGFSRFNFLGDKHMFFWLLSNTWALGAPHGPILHVQCLYSMVRISNKR